MLGAREFNLRALKLECRLLGVPKLLLDGVELDVRYRKVIGLFAFLALEGLTSRARLAGLLWSEVTDDAARRNLRRELHRLKNDLPALNDQLEVSENSLELRAGFLSDVELFERSLEAGQVEQALGFYQGILLEGLELDGATDFHDWLTQKRERLERSRRQAMLESAELLETRGEWRKALEIHHGLLVSDPFQERTHRDVMRLYALLGMREAALSQFEKCQTMLETELGLTPLPETLKLVASIRATKTLEPLGTAQPLSQPQFLAVPLVGRAAAWARMQAAWDANKPIVLSGEPGVGKTRLLLEFATSKAAFEQLIGRPGDAIAPFSTLTRSLQNLLEMTETLLLPTWVRVELSRLLPRMSLELPAPIASPEGHSRFLKAIAEFVLLALQDVPILLADDLQFFDSASFEAALYLVGRFAAVLSDKRVLLSFRRNELSIDAQTMLEDFMLDAQAERIELEALQETETLELVKALVGSSGTDLFGTQLHRATGGNPFFALETIRALFESKFLQLTPDGVWIQDQTADLPIVPSVREAVLRRIKTLGAATGRLLEAACLTSDGFDLETLRGATALSDWEGLEALELALSMRVLEPFGEGYRFSHDLIRSSISDNLSLARKKLLHRKLAASLEFLEAAPASIADHLERAGRAAQAVAWRVQAAEAARRVYANTDALAQYQLALNGASDKLRFEIHLARAQLFEALGRQADRLEALETMREIAGSLNDQHLKIATQLRLAQHYNSLQQHSQAIQTINQLLNQNLEPAENAWALLERGGAFFRSGQLRTGKTDLLRALQHADKLEPRTLGEIHLNLRVIALHEGDFASAEHHAALGLAVCENAGNLVGKLEALTAIARIMTSRGDGLAAIEMLERSVLLAQKIGHVPEQVFALTWLAYNHLRLFHLEKANLNIEQGLMLATKSKDILWHISLLCLQAKRHALNGQLGQAFASFQAALEPAKMASVASEIVALRYLAGFLLEIGQTTQAKQCYDRALQFALTSGIVAYVCSLETGLSRCHLELDDAQAALDHLEIAFGQIERSEQQDKHELWLTQVSLWLQTNQLEQALERFEVLKTELFPEAKLQLLSLELKAHRKLGLTPDFEAAVKAINASPACLASLELRRVLIDMLEPKKALELRAKTKTVLLEMNASLQEFPDLQQSFLAKYHDTLEF